MSLHFCFTVFSDKELDELLDRSDLIEGKVLDSSSGVPKSKNDLSKNIMGIQGQRKSLVRKKPVAMFKL